MTKIDEQRGLIFQNIDNTTLTDVLNLNKELHMINQKASQTTKGLSLMRNITRSFQLCQKLEMYFRQVTATLSASGSEPAKYGSTNAKNRFDLFAR